MLILTIIFLTIVNFFLFKKSIEKENLGISKQKILITYIIFSIFQFFLIYFVYLAFIDIIFSSLLALLLYFNLIYFCVSKIVKNKNQIYTITIRFLKYLVIFEGIIFSSVGVFYMIFLLISKF